MPHCLQPHGHFPAPPPMLFMIQMPPHYDDLFPPNYNTLCLHVTVAVTQTQTYTPAESFPLDPPPPYSIFDPITQSESDDSDVLPQTPLIMIAIWIGICNPSPHTPYILVL